MERTIALDDRDIAALYFLTNQFLAYAKTPPEQPHDDDARRVSMAFLGRVQIVQDKLVAAQKGSH